MRTLLTLGLLMVSTVMFAQNAPSYPYELHGKVADAYFEAYEKKDADMMATYYHDSFNFEDQTIAALTGKPIVFTDKAKTQAFFKDEIMTHIKSLEWKEDERFFSGDQGVFRGTLDIFYHGTIAGESADVVYKWSAPYVVVLTFKEGKITAENDYVNYPKSTWEKQ